MDLSPDIDFPKNPKGQGEMQVCFLYEHPLWVSIFCLTSAYQALFSFGLGKMTSHYHKFTFSLWSLAENNLGAESSRSESAVSAQVPLPWTPCGSWVLVPGSEAPSLPDCQCMAMGFSPSVLLFPQSTVSSNLPKVTKFTTWNFFFIRISISSLLRHCFIVYWYFQIGTTHHQDSSLCVHIFLFVLFHFVVFCEVTLCIIIHLKPTEFPLNATVYIYTELQRY